MDGRRQEIHNFSGLVFLFSFALGYATYSLNGGFVNQGVVIKVGACALIGIMALIAFISMLAEPSASSFSRVD